MKSEIEKSQSNEADDSTLNRRQLLKAGFLERKHFFYKRSRYGTVQISKGGIQ